MARPWKCRCRQSDHTPLGGVVLFETGTAGAGAMTMWPTAAMIADYLEQRLPGKDGEIHVGFTSKQRDEVVAALRLREAAEPFLAFAKSGSFKLFGDDFVLTNGARQAHRQLTASDFRALLAAVGEKEA